MGGVRMAPAGLQVNVYHRMRATPPCSPGLLESQLGADRSAGYDTDIERVAAVRVSTHTPFPAGHDRFSTEQAIRILGSDRTARLQKQGCFHMASSI